MRDDSHYQEHVTRPGSERYCDRPPFENIGRCIEPSSQHIPLLLVHFQLCSNLLESNRRMVHFAHADFGRQIHMIQEMQQECQRQTKICRRCLTLRCRSPERNAHVSSIFTSSLRFHEGISHKHLTLCFKWHAAPASSFYLLLHSLLSSTVSSAFRLTASCLTAPLFTS